jgi:predicted proteasome-type protease
MSANAGAAEPHRRIDNEYFKMIRTRWSFALKEVFSELPNPNW